MSETRQSPCIVERLLAEEASAAARIHVEAFPRHFLTSLGPKFLTLYYRAMAEDRSAIALAGRCDGELCGVCVGSPSPAGFYRRLLASRWLSFGILALASVLRRPSSARRLLRGLSHPGRQSSQPDVAGLFSLAIRPREQQRHLGTKLVERFTVEARRAGSRIIELETDEVDNDSVNAFYERRGFSVRERFITREGRVMRRYVMRIDNTDTVDENSD